jgi:hypothetical protein
MLQGIMQAVAGWYSHYISQKMGNALAVMLIASLRASIR